MSASGHRLKATYLDMLSDAAGFCFDRHHAAPQELAISDPEDDHRVAIEWAEPDDSSRATWANRDDATEAGACAVALASVQLTRGLIVVMRAETLTGVDYFLARPEDRAISMGLEVSGVDAGDLGRVKARLGEKIRQAEAGRSRLPAIALVVGFKALKVLLADVTK